MKIQWKPLLTSILIPLAVGATSALLTKSGMTAFEMVNKPPLTPPDWLFPIVWTVLYILMGIAAYLVYSSEQTSKNALILYGIQLLFNFFWSIFFFQMQWYLFSLIWLVILWGLILATIISFSKSSKTAAYLMIPYLLWVSFAAYLNWGVYRLN